MLRDVSLLSSLSLLSLLSLLLSFSPLSASLLLL